MSPTWKHRILVACGLVSVVATVLVPPAGVALGPVWTKILAGLGLAAALAARVETAIKAAPVVEPEKK